MKKPRVNDFDPNAVSKLKSSFDDMPTIQKSGTSQVQMPTTIGTQTETQPPVVEVTNERSNERTVERRKIRHTFDIFLDQLISLREIALNRERVFGKRFLIGELVQEALEMFITKERSKE